MNATALRARVVLEEARALGLDLADLVAAADGHLPVPTLAAFVAEIERTFTPGTAATYRPYWRGWPSSSTGTGACPVSGSRTSTW